MKNAILAICLILGSVNANAAIVAIPQAPRIIDTVSHTCVANCPSMSAFSGFVLGSVTVGTLYLIAYDKPQACDFEPSRTVRKAGENYTFSVAGCEYEANKAKYIVMK